MAERRPLVLVNGQISELPAGDTLPGAGVGGSASWSIVTTGQTLVANAPGVLAVLPEGDRDPFAGSVVSHLRFDGTDGSTTFTDETGRRTWSAVGNAQISTTTPRNGTGALLLDGTGDGVAPSATNITDFAFPGDFTVEFDMRIPAAVGANQVLLMTAADTNNSGAFYIGLIVPRTIQIYSYVNMTVVMSSSIALTDNVWTRVAVSRVGSTMRLFLGGVLAGSATNSQSFAGTTSARLGITSAGTNGFNGRIDNLRITKGVGRYTADYSVSPDEFPLSAGNALFDFPLPASFVAGDSFRLANARGSVAGSLARIVVGAGRQIIGAPVGDDVVLDRGDTAVLVARSATELEVV